MKEQAIDRAVADLQRQAERRSGQPVDNQTLFLAVAACVAMHREMVNSIGELTETIRATREGEAPCQ